MLPSDIIEYTDIESFFTEKWAPTIQKLHTMKGGILSDFLLELCKILQTLQTHEVAIKFKI